MSDPTVILYDLSASQPIGSSPVSGGGAYAKRVYRRLLNTLLQFGSKGKEINAVAVKNNSLDQDLVELSKKAGVEIIYVEEIQKELIPLIKSLQVDIFFSALPIRFKNLAFPDFVKFIYTIHGLRPIELLNDKFEHLFFYSRRSIIKYLVTRLIPRIYLRKRIDDFNQLFNAAVNKVIITVSVHSRYALLSEFPHLDSDEILTFFSPHDERLIEPDSSILKEMQLEPGEFFLLICGNRWAKNPYRAILALQNLSKKGLLKKKVLITGRGKVSYLNKVEKSPRFQVSGYLSQEQLEAIYQNAYAFLFPTLNEGFGYPPLECMKYGTPVMTSPINSLPELLADSVLWCDPYSIREMEGRILRLQNDEIYHRELKEKGKEQETIVRKQQNMDLDSLVSLILEERVAGDA